MRKKDVIWSVKPSEKNKIYLERLGFIDGRSGKVRKGMNLNEFLNQCVTMVCESTMINEARPMANSEDLLKAWKKYELGLRARAIARIQKEIVTIANMRTDREMARSAQEVLLQEGVTEDLL